MSRAPHPAPKLFLTLVVVVFACLHCFAQAGTTRKKPNVTQELMQTETGFFEAWKGKDLSYFRDHIAAEGISWGKNGTFSRDEQLQEQQNSAKNCVVDGYSLSDFSVLPLSTGAYLLTYRAEQYATCGGEKLPVHVNGSSVYVLKNGRLLTVYRAEVPLENQR